MAERSEAFAAALAHTLGIEGGFSDREHDRGGATHYGITESTARKWGYDGPMKDLPPATCEDIYYLGYWQGRPRPGAAPRLNLEGVAGYDRRLAMECFDSAVNCGIRNAGRWLQQAINLANRNESLFDDIAEDGWVGEKTTWALRQLRRPYDPTVLIRLMDCLQGQHYIALARRDPSQEYNLAGWINQRIGAFD